VENKSFAELLCTRQKELLNPITERPLHFPLKAVQLAFTFLWDDGTPPPRRSPSHPIAILAGHSLDKAQSTPAT